MAFWMKPTAPKILVVDDEPSMREFLEIMLEKEGYQVVCAADGEQALRVLEQQTFDIVVTDIRMKPVNGLEVLKGCKAKSPNTVVIMISAYASAETAVAAMREGAYDYLPKPFKIDEMRTVLRNALESKGEDRPPRPAGESHHFGLLIGDSSSMRKIYELIEKVATTSSNVLITGESGTGKELVARAIHGESARGGHPLVAVNCGGVPETLIESELFGYKKGAFTGAATNRTGLVEAAQKGTLFLDEIGDLSPSLQVKILRLVQQKTIKMIGDTVDIPVDVRIISATNRDLEQMVMEGSFREDLFYRLNVIHLRLPPLRERREDIAPLADYFLTKFSREFNKDVRKVSAYAMDILKGYDFPGNVRELENIIERGVALESSSIILPESLTLAAFKRTQLYPEPTMQPSLPPGGMDLDQYLADIEKDLLVQALEAGKGVKQDAAALLGLSFRSFRYRLLKYGLTSETE